MTRTVAVEILKTADAYANRPAHALQEQFVFLLPRWIQIWRQTFTPDDELHICLMKKNQELIGVAPLAVTGTTAAFVGDPEICDYLDFAVAPGHEEVFYRALLDNLADRRVTKLDLRCLRPESTVFSHLVDEARTRNALCSVEPDGVSVEMDLPGDWEEYLNSLDGRQRHEIRRKFRRLHEKGETHFGVLQDMTEADEPVDTFLKMFRESRSDKAAFLTPHMESFFRSMISAMAEEGILRLFFLTLNDSPVAGCLCFDFKGTMYLYNSGYDMQYASLSVGLLCKILSIRHAIELGRGKYDFLKGDELYKYHLGGRQVRLSRCRISMKT